jgi:ketosteroid isomerase-like protein
MSQADLELLRKGIDAWNRRDVDLWLNCAAREIEWLPAGPAAVEREVYRGYDEVRSGITAAWETYDVFELQEDQVRDLGDSALWLGRVKMHGSASGVELDQEFAVHGVIRDGRFILIHTILSWQAALEAVGLQE